MEGVNSLQQEPRLALVAYITLHCFASLRIKQNVPSHEIFDYNNYNVIHCLYSPTVSKNTNATNYT